MAAIKSYKEFWPYYAGEHAPPTCRRPHFIGTTIVMLFAVAALVTHHYWLFAMMPVAGYGFAWVGHFVIEKNRPATFTYPFGDVPGGRRARKARHPLGAARVASAPAGLSVATSQRPNGPIVLYQCDAGLRFVRPSKENRCVAFERATGAPTYAALIARGCQ